MKKNLSLLSSSYKTLIKSQPLNKFSYILLLLVLSGCASYSTFQTARVLEKKQLRLALNGEYYSLTKDTNYLPPDPITDNGCSPNLFNSCAVKYGSTFQNLGLSTRMGMGHDLDLGVQVSLPFTMTIDMKYQFVDWEGFSISTGVGFQFFHIYPRSTYLGYDSSLFAIVLPLYLSYDFNDYFALYGAGKFSPSLPTYNQTFPQSSVYAASAGIKIGKNKGIFIEGTWAQSSHSASQIMTIGTSLFITFFPNKKLDVNGNAIENP